MSFSALIGCLESEKSPKQPRKLSTVTEEVGDWRCVKREDASLKRFQGHPHPGKPGQAVCTFHVSRILQTLRIAVTLLRAYPKTSMNVILKAGKDLSDTSVATDEVNAPFELFRTVSIHDRSFPAFAGTVALLRMTIRVFG